MAEDSNDKSSKDYGTGYVRGKANATWWMEQIRKGIAYRRKYAMESEWSRWRSYYRGRWPKGTLPVNLFFRMVRTVVPRIYFRNPSISIQPGKPGREQAAFAKLIQRIDNKLMRTMRIKQQIKMITQQTWMFGSGVGKRGFGENFHPSPELLSAGSAPLAEGEGSKIDRQVEYHNAVIGGQPWFLENPTGDFIVPAGSRNFQECRWYASWYRRPLLDLQADNRFENTAALAGSHRSGYNADRKALLTGDMEPSENMVDLVEVRDMATKQAFVLAPFGQTDRKCLFQDDDTLQVNNRPPFYTVVFNPDDEVCWGVPDSVILEPQQMELNEIRTLEMKHRRLAIIKLIYKKNSITKEQFEKLLNGDVAAGIEVNGELADIDNFQVADIPQSLRGAGREVMEDVRENMGFSRNQFGNYAEGSADRTATESRIVEAASEIRVDERRDTIADLMVDVFEDVHVDIFDRWTDEIVVDVMGPEGLPLWVAFKPNMLKAAQYELKIDPDSSVPETKEVRMQKAIITYERLKTNPLIDPELLTQYMLNELHGVQFDNMLRSLAQLQQRQQASGAPGSTQENPVGVGQFMEMMARGRQAA